jgi:ubiquinone/menaquinone biosynthesis C-methylase UbiE
MGFYKGDRLYGRERVCARFIDSKVNSKTLNIGAGEMQWIENILFLDNKLFISSDINKNNLGEKNKAINKMIIDATKISLSDNSVSQVIILDVLEHIRDHEKAVSEISRVTKKNGCLVVCVPNDTLLSYLNPVRYAQHERHYKIKDIKELLEKNGFKIDKIFAGGGLFELASLYVHFAIKYIAGKK